MHLTEPFRASTILVTASGGSPRSRLRSVTPIRRVADAQTPLVPLARLWVLLPHEGECVPFDLVQRVDRLGFPWASALSSHQHRRLGWRVPNVLTSPIHPRVAMLRHTSAERTLGSTSTSFSKEPPAAGCGYRRLLILVPADAVRWTEAFWPVHPPERPCFEPDDISGYVN